jgi:hypothetical protein
MRKETREYNFDWMLMTTFRAASQLKRGSQKEYQISLQYIPYFRGIVEYLLECGKPGEIFIDLCATFLENIVYAKEQGKKTSMTTFCFAPALFYAMDVVPVCLEVLTVMQTLTYRRGTAEYLDYCNEVGYTETSCSAQRGTLGAYLAGNGAPIDMIVTDTPGVCDTNANAFSFASAWLDRPFYQLDIPPRLTGDDVDSYHLQDYRGLIGFLESQTGNRLDEDRLRSILEEVKLQDDLIAELEDMCRIVPNPLPVTANFMIYAARFQFMGMPKCTELLESLVETGKENMQQGISGLASGKENLRAFFCYIDHFTQDLRLWQYLDDRGITPQGNILSRSWTLQSPQVRELGLDEAAYSIDTTSMESMIRSLSSMNSRMPMVKSIRGPYDGPHMWLDEAISLASMGSVDLIVYNGTPGCRNTWGMVKLFARDTEKAGFPTYIMYADAFDDRVESWETTRDRFDEFLQVRGLL